jgi:hypothetical protein
VKELTGKKGMPEKPTNQSEPTQASGEGQPLREELRREHRLVRSTGVISKGLMALAFGVVFLLVAALVAAPLGHWLWAFVLGAIGAASVAWSMYTRTSRTGKRRA